MRNKCLKYIGKIALFLVGIGICLQCLNVIFQPVWREWNNFDTLTGFYSEPDNTIETVFLGSSFTVNGITPIELYKDFGICAYNLGTIQQPMLATYYWLEEAYQYHAETLDTVVLDVSMLRKDSPASFYHYALDGMKFSENKINAVLDYAQTPLDVAAYLIPFVSYHSRWDSLTAVDFAKNDLVVKDFVRGYNFVTDSSIRKHTLYKDIRILQNYPFDPTAEATELYGESLDYFAKLVDFCDQHELNLLLIKTPGIGIWSSSDHIAVQQVADYYGLEFIDFNYDPLLSELGYNHAVDSVDGGHLNYYGATKLTHWLGQYIVEHYDATDVRESESFAFMDEQLDEYNRNVGLAIDLFGQTDIADYLQVAMDNEDCTIFVMAKNEASNAMTPELRSSLSEIGLIELANLQYRESYLAVIEQGEVLMEMSQLSDIASSTDNTLYICREGVLQNGATYEVQSGGYNMGNVASCVIDDVEYALNERGLNVVVYNNNTKQVVDSTYFDTSVASSRNSENYEEALATESEVSNLSGELKNLYMYNQRVSGVQQTVQLGEDGMLLLLEQYQNIEDYTILISAYNDAAAALDDNARLFLTQMGLNEISALEEGDSYLAVVDGGEVVVEKRDHGEVPIAYQSVGYDIISGGCDSGNVSSIRINGTEYSKMSCGFNVVIFDKTLQMVVISTAYDTSSILQRVPEK